MRNKLLVLLLAVLSGALSVSAQHNTPQPVATNLTAEGHMAFSDYRAADFSGSPNPIVIITKQVVVDYQCIPNPGNPPTGNIRVYCDSGTGILTCLTSTGTSCSGGVTPNTPTPQAGVGPGFNVKNYGAKGDSRTCDVAASAGGGTTHMTGACNYSAADVGKSVFFNFGPIPTNALFASVPTITAFNSSTDVTLSLPQAGGAVTGFVVIGTIDDTPIATALAAALAAAKGVQGAGNRTAFSATPVLYFPSGGYFLCTLAAALTITGVDGFVMTGDGPDSTFLYFPNGSAGGCNIGNPPISVAGSALNIEIKNMTLDGVNNSNVGLLNNAGNLHLYNLTAQRSAGTNLTSTACINNQANLFGELLRISNCGDGLKFSGGNAAGEIRNWTSSNNFNRNIVISGSIGVPNGPGVRFYGGLNDECTGDRCFDVINSHDVWIIGSALFSGATKATGAALHVDANSHVHMNGGISGVFLQDSDENGTLVDAGGVLEESDVRNIGSGTRKCITNNGTLLDNGHNTCESQFLITSGTSTGTAAVLTVTPATANANANCTTGDSLTVQGASIAGYNGAGLTITGVTATTISYTTIGSNLGAAGNAGAAYCVNMQTYSGNLPKAQLNNPVPNTCYITGVFAATVTGAPMCNFRTQSFTNITRITASSTTSTTCAAAPVLTISDGTVSITLTLTTGKSQWDSAVDSSTGVGTTIFKPNGTIQVTNTAGTCSVPPANFSVSYNISPILSNNQ